MTIKRYHLRGLGRSEEALRAEERGALPASRAARALGMRSASLVAQLLPRVGVFEVGKYGMHVPYYDVTDAALRALLEKNQEDNETSLAPAATRLCAGTIDAFTKSGHRKFSSRLWDIVRARDARRKRAA